MVREAHREPEDLRPSVCLEIKVGVDDWKAGRAELWQGRPAASASESSGCRKLLCKAVNS